MSKQSVLLWVCAIFSDTHQKLCNHCRLLFRLTRKDSGYKGGSLPKEALDAFCILKNSLVFEPVMAFPRADRQYALITDAATGTADTAGGLGAILTQKDKCDHFYAISYTSRQLKEHKKITRRFFLNPLLPCGEWTLLMNTSKEKIYPLHGS
jgi:RNase H-like domain found in reverse transcriptase